jgi:hypothetical protein
LLCVDQASLTLRGAGGLPWVERVLRETSADGTKIFWNNFDFSLAYLIYGKYYNEKSNMEMHL